MNWQANYRAHWFLIPGAEKEMLAWLNAKVPGLHDVEIDAAVDSLGSTWKDKYPPRPADLRDAILASRRGSVGVVDHRERLSKLMARMKDETPEQRWVTICEPSDWAGIKDWDKDDMCCTLERYAETLDGKFKRLNLSELGALADGIGNKKEV